MEYTEIKTFSDACKIKGIDETAFNAAFEALPEQFRKPMRSHAQLVVIAETLNDGWKPDWNNTREPKYNPWFEVIASKDQPSGSGLACHDYDFWYSATTIGSRLCFKTAKLAEYAGKQFKELYEDYFLIK